MPTVDVEDIRLHYEEYGSPDGQPLMLLHNFTGTGATVWERDIPAFHAYRLIVPDWRGHGKTNNPRGLQAMNHRQFAEDIVGLCDALGLTEPIFCGFSSGAMLLLSLAVASPMLPRALVLAACTHYLPVAAASRIRGLAADALPPQRVEQLQRIHAQDPGHWRRVCEAFVALTGHERSEDYPSRDEIGRIEAPALVLHGDKDQLFPVEIPVELHSLLPDSELCILPATGHGLPAERPEWFQSIVLDFLGRRVAT
jgi:pimeloyl-ACP methyl ester carboxylesterase